MNKLKTCIRFTAIAAALFGAWAFMAQQPAKLRLQPGSGKGFAVIELFTSEGCSSCPPADALISELQRQDTAGQLYILAFHVDYWDHQGWKDRFSDHAYSLRQRQYADWLNVPTVYTPQLIVNGSSEHIGSDAAAVSAAVNHALEKNTARELSLAAKLEGQRLLVTADFQPQNGQDLLVALVQREAESRVKAGENSGRQLAHVQLVRRLEKAKGREVRISLPPGFGQQSWEVVGFLQDRRTGVISGAARVKL